MNRKLISDALGNINSAYITQSMEAPEKMAHRPPERTKTMGKFEKEKNRGYSRKLVSLILAACLVFALAITAYAANWFGIRELFRTYNRELPEAAEPYIQQHTETAATEDWSAPATEAETAPEDWSARVTESLCDASQILVSNVICSVEAGVQHHIEDEEEGILCGLAPLSGNGENSEQADTTA